MLDTTNDQDHDFDSQVEIQKLHMEVSAGLKVCCLRDTLPNRYDMFQIKYDMLSSQPLTEETGRRLELMNTTMLHILTEMQLQGSGPNKKPFKI